MADLAESEIGRGRHLQMVVGRYTRYMTPSEWSIQFVRGFVKDANDANRAWKHYLDWYRAREENSRGSDRAWTTLMGEFLFRLSLSYEPGAIQMFEENRNDFVWRDRASWRPVVHIEYENNSAPPETLRSEVVRLQEGRAELSVLITFDAGIDTLRQRVKDAVREELRRLNFDHPFLLLIGGLLDDPEDWKAFEFLNRDWTQIN